MAHFSHLSRNGRGRNFLYLVAVVLIGMFVFPHSVLADIAPPESPPGSNLQPGSDATWVRMESETVILDVLSQSQGRWIGQAKVTATFHMRNQGSADESIQVRFPLSNVNGWGDGFGNYPEIRDLRVKVGGKTVPTQRITTPNPSLSFDHQIPWAAFQVAFPVQQLVEIEVTYTADGFGEDNFVVFNYILETGSGWYDTIGSADLIVRLPFNANPLNVIFDQIGFGITSPGADMRGSEMLWHYEDLEPGASDNLQVALVTPAAWNKVLLEQGRVEKNPNDGEAWGRLGKAYKEIITLRKGLRLDEGGQDAYRLAVEAYDRAVTLKPNDALWHYGFADLLWSRFYWVEYWKDQRDYADLSRAVLELKRCLELDPGNQQGLEMLDWVGSAMPEAVDMSGSQVTYLILTATPLPKATVTQPASHTPVFTITEAPLATVTRPATVTQADLPSDTPAPQSIATTAPNAATTESTQVASSGKGLLPCGAALLPWIGLLIIGFPLKFLKTSK